MRTAAKIAAFAVATATLLPSSAQAWTQPYGGCKEAWQAPTSAGADECRDHGWLVRKRLVVNPHSVVKFNRLPHCTTEDGVGQGPCTWNIGRTDGNGVGAAYWVDRRDRVHYVWRQAPRNPWRWPTPTEQQFYDITPNTQIALGIAHEFFRTPDGDSWGSGSMATES
jgi:hypothetical protein